jgi:hypothetical protein
MVGMVAQVCNPSYLEGGDLRIMDRGQPGQKVCKTSSYPMAGAVVCASHPSYVVKHK